MTTTMTCRLFEDRLMAYLEQEVDDATRVAMDRHAVGCTGCGALIADMRRIRFDAARLPELQPSRDLWAGIADRIQAPVVSIGSHRPERGARTGREWTRFAVIAASLVAAAGLGYLSAGGRRPVAVSQSAPADSAVRIALAPVAAAPASVDTASASPASPASAASSRSAAVATPAARSGRAAAPMVPNAAQTVQVAYARVSEDYDREIARLRELIDRRRGQIDPVTVAIIEKNLMVIDTAIAQCRLAIARDPASRFLLESLNQSLQTKVELMRTAALLPSRT